MTVELRKTRKCHELHQVSWPVIQKKLQNYKFSVFCLPLAE